MNADSFIDNDQGNDCYSDNVGDTDSEEIIYNDDNSSLNPDNSFNETQTNNNNNHNDNDTNANVNEVNESFKNNRDDGNINKNEFLLLQSPEFKKETDDDCNRNGEDNAMENEPIAIHNKQTINLPTKVSKEEFDSIKEVGNLPIISPSPIKRPITIGMDEISLNVELKNNNEFIDMDHFDEASKIGFGLLDEDMHKQKVEVLNSNENKGKEGILKNSNKIKPKSNLLLKLEDKEEDLAPKESPYKKLMKNYDKDLILDFPFLRINNQVLLQKEIQDNKTYNKFINGKIGHYIHNDQPPITKESRPKRNENSRQRNNNKNVFKAKKSLKQQLDSNIKNDQINSNDTAGSNKGTKEINTKASNPTDLILNDKAKLTHSKTEKESLFINDDIKSRRLLKENSSLRDKLVELNSILFQLQEEGDQIDKELQKKNEKLTEYLDKYDILTQENQSLVAKEENMQVDYNIIQNESQKKSDKIGELQNQYDLMDQDHQYALKKQEMDSIIQKETKQSYDTYKSNYTDMRSQYDLLNIKYQTIADENFNFKRDVLLYEKELKTKSEMIDKLRINLLESAKLALNTEQTMEVVNITTKDSFNSDTGKNDETRPNKFFGKEKDKIRNRVKSKPALEDRGAHSLERTNVVVSESINIDKDKEKVRDKSMERIKAFPKEDQVKQIKVKISKLIQERDQIKCYLNKLPEHLRKKDLIDKRSEMETKINKLDTELGKWRAEIKAMKIIEKE